MGLKKISFLEICMFFIIIVISAIPFQGIIKPHLPGLIGSIWKELFIITIFILVIFRDLLYGHIFVGNKLITSTLLLNLLYWCIRAAFSDGDKYLITLSLLSIFAYIPLFLLIFRATRIYPRLSINIVISSLLVGGIIGFLTIPEVVWNISLSDSSYDYIYFGGKLVIRAKSTVGSALGLGYYLTMLVVPFIWVNGNTKISILIKLLINISFIGIGIGIFLSTCRGALLIALISSILYFILTSKNFKIRKLFSPKKLFYTALVVILIILVILSIIWIVMNWFEIERTNTILERLLAAFNVSEESNETRFARWYESWQLIADNGINGIVFGVGVGYAGNLPGIVDIKTFIPESWILKLLINGGILGLVLWYIPVIIVMAQAFIRFRDKNIDEGMLIKCLFSSIMGLLLVMIWLQVLDFYLNNMFFWLFLGLLSGLTHLRNNTPGSRQSN
jgi:hypothetical protein